MRSFSDDPQTIVGVAGDVRTFGLEDEAGFVFYGSSSQYTGWNPMTLVWRSLDATSQVDTVRAAIRSIDAGVPLSDVASMDTLIDRSFGPRRFNLYLLAAFAGVALALAAIGLFGVMAYLVSQRTREIGVRLALGATRAEVFRVILGRGVSLAAIGAVGRRRRRLLAHAGDGKPAVLGVADGSGHVRRRAARPDRNRLPGLLCAGAARDAGRPRHRAAVRVKPQDTETQRIQELQSTCWMHFKRSLVSVSGLIQ